MAVDEIEYMRGENEEQKGMIENLSEEAEKTARTCEAVVADNQRKEQIISQLRDKQKDATMH